MGRAVLQYSHCTCDTAQGARLGAQGVRGERRACAGSAGGRQGARRRARGAPRR